LIIEKLNRKIPPPIHEVRSVILPPPQLEKLDNGIPVYITRMGTQEIMKIEIVTLSGRPQEEKKLVSRAVNRQLREGTAHHKAAELAEKIDFYAGTVQSPVHLDTGNIVLYCMTKHFKNLLPLLAEMYWQPTFDEQELATYVENNIQNLIVDLSKNDVVAYRQITELMYGKDHPYGYNSTSEIYRALKRTDLLHFHEEHYKPENMFIVISGRFDDTVLYLLNQYFGKISANPKIQNTPLSFNDIKPQKLRTHNPNSLQTAIRIGKRFGNRTNPDFDGFFILNTILGGYFGSRLMTNIREKKGYTYNIYASLDMMKQDGFFYVGAEVGNEYVEPTLKEIYKEMLKLQNNLVKPEELKMVRNYLLGNLLNMVDGPFAVSDVIRTFVTDGVEYAAFQRFVDTITHISPIQLRVLAQKYFIKEEMFEVIVGS
jgi:zinc protease